MVGVHFYSWAIKCAPSFFPPFFKAWFDFVFYENITLKATLKSSTTLKSFTKDNHCEILKGRSEFQQFHRATSRYANIWQMLLQVINMCKILVASHDVLVWNWWNSECSFKLHWNLSAIVIQEYYNLTETYWNFFSFSCTIFCYPKFQL